MVWLDLDNTLVSTVHILSPEDDCDFGCGDPRLLNLGGATLRAWCRPGAAEFIAALRARYGVRLLTMATCEYALEMNTTFQLGFNATEIFAREDWTDCKPRPSVLERDIDPMGVIVDNVSTKMAVALRSEYLGNRGRWVLVPDFLPEFETSILNWDQYLQRIAELHGKLA